MKICSHVITYDIGLAPNPFHDFCTSALCTPSHMNARLQPDDWLVGNSPKDDGNRLVYAMRISEVMSMNGYFDDPRFQRKKPKPEGSPVEQCGDNIYQQSQGGLWKRLESKFHNDPKSLGQDPGHPFFVAEHYFYFGRERTSIPQELTKIIKGAQGIKYTANHVAHDFVFWLEANFEPGVLGMPRDMTDSSAPDGFARDCVLRRVRRAKSDSQAGCRPSSPPASEIRLGNRSCR
jgi:Nucleotide modification associated domain 2